MRITQRINGTVHNGSPIKLAKCYFLQFFISFYGSDGCYKYNNHIISTRVRPFIKRRLKNGNCADFLLFLLFFCFFFH